MIADPPPPGARCRRSSGGPLFSRLFTPSPHAVLDAGKVTRVLGIAPQYDLRSGHAQTLPWFVRTGAADVDRALSDPRWGRTFDFDHEAAIADLARNQLAGRSS